MCGIVGFVDNKKKKEKEKIIKSMADEIAYRGPDGEGFYVDDVVALGHRRLSIIDVSGGSQPIYNQDKTLAIVYNGEIYNYKELKEELEEKGYVFQTKTDTEVILHGYAEWKDDIFYLSQTLHSQICRYMQAMSSYCICRGSTDHPALRQT